jgi:hypothetical protein
MPGNMFKFMRIVFRNIQIGAKAKGHPKERDEDTQTQKKDEG